MKRDMQPRFAEHCARSQKLQIEQCLADAWRTENCGSAALDHSAIEHAIEPIYACRHPLRAALPSRQIPSRHRFQTWVNNDAIFVNDELVPAAQMARATLFCNPYPARVPRVDRFVVELDDTIDVGRQRCLRVPIRKEHTGAIQHGRPRLEITHKPSLAGGHIAI